MTRLLSIPIPASIFVALISDILIVAGLYVAAQLLLSDDMLLASADGSHLIGWAVVVLCVMIGLHFNDLYAGLRIRSAFSLAQRICLTIGLTFLMQALIAYSGAEWRMSLPAMIAGSFACLVVLPVWRLIHRRFVVQAVAGEKILFLGFRREVGETVDFLGEHSELGFEAIGVVANEPPAGSRIPYLGTPQHLRQILSRTGPDRLVADLDAEPALLDLKASLPSGLKVEAVPSFYETLLGRVSLASARPEEFLGLPRKRLTEAAQAGLSYVAALTGLILAAPVMLAVALAVKCSSKGPILFRQVRVGLNGRNFTIFKFRSMYTDAEARTGAVWAQKNDPRVTPVGRWIRLLRLDELPQLINVLKGDMAIVGPRPERPEFVKPLSEKIPLYLYRHNVKPGITGWAQINARYANSVEDTALKLEYDLYFIKHRSLSLDLLIMFQTVKTMLLTRGAY